MNNPQQHTKKQHKEALYARRGEIIKGIIGVSVFIVLILVVSKFIDLGKLREIIQKSGVYGPLIFILAKISTIVFAPLSGSPLYVIAGTLFGFWHGVLYVFIGDVIGGSIAFFLSRLLGKKVLRLFLSENSANYINDIISHLGNWKGFIYARLIFIGMYDVVSYAAGLSRIPYWQYVLINSTIAIVPLMFLIGAGTLIIDKKVLTIVRVAAVTIAVVGVSMLFVIYWRKKCIKNQTTE